MRYEREELEGSNFREKPGTWSGRGYGGSTRFALGLSEVLFEVMHKCNMGGPWGTFPFSLLDNRGPEQASTPPAKILVFQTKHKASTPSFHLPLLSSHDLFVADPRPNHAE